MAKTGQELQEARRDAGLTQEQVAGVLKVRVATVSDWENKASVPDVKADRYLRVVRDLASQAA